MRNKKGFTLIELLAVIVILGLLIAIAIPSITRYITQSRKKTLATTISKYVDSGLVSVNNGEYIFNDSNVIYAIPIECIPMERGGDNPFGEWNQVNNEYWAYVLVQYNPDDFSYKYGFTFKDSAGYGMHPVSLEDMDVKGKDILTNLDLVQPRTGLASNFSTVDYWEKSGFNVNEETRVKVLQSRIEGKTGDGENTCTLHNKGLNYEELAEIRSRSGTLLNQGNYVSQVFGKKINRTEVEEIYTLDYIDIPTNVIDSWDVSIQKNGSIMAYITDKDKDNFYELYLAQEGGVIAPANSSYLFGHFRNVTVLDLSNFITKNVVDMSDMFLYCHKVMALDVSDFSTAKVLNMSDMFYGCGNVSALDVSNWDVSNVTNMYRLFLGCNKVLELDVSKWITTNVTDMSGIFYGCAGLTILDVSNFDTSNVTNMSGMFRGCSKLTELNVEGFDTSKVTDMGEMFLYCGNLINLDLSKWDTSNVTSMYHMFKACQKLSMLNIDNFDTSSVINMYGMFMYCYGLTSLNLNSFDTSNVTNMYGMFYSCANLTFLDLSMFDTSKVTNMGEMFQFCNRLENLDIRNFDFSKVTNYGSMLNYVPTTSKIIVKDDNTRNWIQTNVSSNFTNIVTAAEL